MAARSILRFVAVLCAAFLPWPAAAQEPVHVAGLGSLSFPNSGDIEAQDDFRRGVLLLHSFESGYAVDAFRRAQGIDPDFALAYWGEAMTYTHPVWNQNRGPDPEPPTCRCGPVRSRRRSWRPTATSTAP